MRPSAWWRRGSASAPDGLCIGFRGATFTASRDRQAGRQLREILDLVVTRARLLPRLAVLAAFVTAKGFAAAQGVAPPASSAGTYVRETWTVADGLPINTITSVVQTRDGYLWLGTNDGVVRFDGVRFTVYNAGNTPELPSADASVSDATDARRLAPLVVLRGAFRIQRLLDVATSLLAGGDGTLGY